MTLTEARKILERNHNLFHGELGEAIDAAISVLPYEMRERPTVKKRLAEMLYSFTKAEIPDPFNRKRFGDIVIYRQCIFYALRKEGYTYDEIGKATGYDHSTVFWGKRRISNGLDVRDRQTVKVWNEVSEAIYNY